MNQLTIKQDQTPVDFFGTEALDLIKNKIRSSCKGNIADQSIDEYLFHCAGVGLNPLKNQIHALPFWDKELKGFRLVPQVSIDGLRAIAHRTGDCNGIQTKCTYDSKGKLIGAKGLVYRKKGKYLSNVIFSEYTSGYNLWVSKPETMIQKVAEAHALRRAFPEFLGGLYSPEEFEQNTTVEEPKQQKQVKQTKQDWKSISKRSIELKTFAETKGIDLKNGFAPEIIKNINYNFTEKVNYDNIVTDLDQLELLINEFKPKAIEDAPKKKAGRPAKAKITLDTVTSYAQNDCSMEPDVFMDRYKHELEAFNNAKRDGDTQLGDESLYAIMDDLKMYNAEVTK